MLRLKSTIRCCCVIICITLIISIICFMNSRGNMVPNAWDVIYNICLGAMTSTIVVLIMTCVELRKHIYKIKLEAIKHYSDTFYLLIKLEPVKMSSPDYKINYYCKVASLNVGEIRLLLDEIKYCLRLYSPIDEEFKRTYRPDLKIFFQIMDYYMYVLKVSLFLVDIKWMDLSTNTKKKIVDEISDKHFFDVLFIENEKEFCSREIHYYVNLGNDLFRSINSKIYLDDLDYQIVPYKWSK